MVTEIKVRYLDGRLKMYEDDGDGWNISGILPKYEKQILLGLAEIYAKEEIGGTFWFVRYIIVRGGWSQISEEEYNSG